MQEGEINKNHLFNCSIVLYKTALTDVINIVDILLQHNDLHHLYLIDNSPKNEIQQNLPIDSRIIYIHNQKNIGFGAAHNIALKHTITQNINFHLVVNADVSFNPNIIATIIAQINEYSRIGNIMPKVLYPDGKLQYLCRKNPTPYFIFYKKLIHFFHKSTNKIEDEYVYKNEISYDEAVDIPFLSGCFMFLNTKVLKEIGLFDEKFFLYFEDADLCRRINKAGYKNLYFPKVTITHQYQKGSAHSLKLAWEATISALYYFRKWGW